MVWGGGAPISVGAQHGAPTGRTREHGTARSRTRKDNNGRKTVVVLRERCTDISGANRASVA